MTSRTLSFVCGALAAGALVVALGCPPAPVEQCVDEPEGSAGRDGLTWHANVAPLLDAKCNRCHREGGLAPFALDSYDDAAAFSSAIKAAVVSRQMPPWMPARCCGDFANDASLSEQEIADIARWVDDGAPEGSADATPDELVAPPDLPRTDVTIAMPEPYEPAPPDGGIDDYRCFLVEWPEEEERFVTGFRLRPGNAAVLHHALVLILGPDQVENHRAYDDLDERPGWSCPGGGVLGATGYLGGWSPGWEAQLTPEDHGHRVAPGSALVFSMHYTTPADPDAQGPDQTEIDVMMVDEVADTLQSIAVLDAAWPLGGMPIPADEPDVRHAVEYDPTAVYGGGRPLLLHSVNLHMHERGHAGTVAIKRADGSEECLVQIDDYKHEWQGDYLFREPVRIEPGDRLFAECRFDNTAGRQRVINGEREEPRDLNWGDAEEMCVAYVIASATPL